MHQVVYTGEFVDTIINRHLGYPCYSNQLWLPRMKFTYDHSAGVSTTEVIDLNEWHLLIKKEEKKLDCNVYSIMGKLLLSLVSSK